MKLQTKIFLVVILILFVASGIFYFSWKSEKQERKRQESNVEQLTGSLDQTNIALNLTRKEFEQAKTGWKMKLDSVMTAHKIALKSVKSATILKTEYKDTGSVKIVYKQAEKQPDESFIIPISSEGQCWGMKGEILTKDANSKFRITEKTAVNSSQLFVIKRRFLGFLWYNNRRNEYRAFTDCGEVDFTNIEFVKK